MESTSKISTVEVISGSKDNGKQGAGDPSLFDDFREFMLSFAVKIDYANMH